MDAVCISYFPIGIKYEKKNNNKVKYIFSSGMKKKKKEVTFYFNLLPSNFTNFSTAPFYTRYISHYKYWYMLENYWNRVHSKVTEIPFLSLKWIWPYQSQFIFLSLFLFNRLELDVFPKLINLNRRSKIFSVRLAEAVWDNNGDRSGHSLPPPRLKIANYSWRFKSPQCITWWEHEP